MSINISVVGNLGKDSETKQTRSGKTFTTFTLGHTPREKRDGEWVDGETIWFKVTVWAQLPNIVLTKGRRVFVTGVLRQESYEKDGQKRTSLTITADAVGEVIQPVREIVPVNDFVPSNDWALVSDDTPF